jgi:hypothetical protein
MSSVAIRASMNPPNPSHSHTSPACVSYTSQPNGTNTASVTTPAQAR